MVVGRVKYCIGSQESTGVLEEGSPHHVEGVWSVGVSPGGNYGSKTTKVRELSTS